MSLALSQADGAILTARMGLDDKLKALAKIRENYEEDALPRFDTIKKGIEHINRLRNMVCHGRLQGRIEGTDKLVFLMPAKVMKPSDELRSTTSVVISEKKLHEVADKALEAFDELKRAWPLPQYGTGRLRAKPSPVIKSKRFKKNQPRGAPVEEI